MTQGEKLRYRRKVIGMTQDELASRLGYSSKSSIAYIESGRSSIPLHRVKEFAAVLACDPQDLADDLEPGPTGSLVPNYAGKRMPAEVFMELYPEGKNPFEATVVAAFRSLSGAGKLALLQTALELMKEEGLTIPEEDE